jgi:hypothetical protein
VQRSPGADYIGKIVDGVPSLGKPQIKNSNAFGISLSLLLVDDSLTFVGPITKSHVLFLPVGRFEVLPHMHAVFQLKLA